MWLSDLRSERKEKEKKRRNIKTNNKCIYKVKTKQNKERIQRKINKML